MKKIITIFIAFLFVLNFSSTAFAGGPGGSWLSGYSYRKKITISHLNVKSDLLNFPLLVKINGDSDIASNISDKTNGSDVRFTDSNGLDQLSFEKANFNIEKGSAYGNFWVKIPIISSSVDTDFYIYYGNSSPGAPQTDVWDSNYSGVWHLDSDSMPGSLAIDSTLNGNNGTNFGVAITGGVINSAYDLSFPGSVSVSKDVSIPPMSSFSVSAWFKTTGSSGFQTLVTKSNFSNKNFWLGLNNDNEIEFSFSHMGISNVGDATSTSTFSDNVWHFAEATYDGSDIKIYIDGNLETTQSAPNPDTIGVSTQFGFDTIVPNRFTGQLDEVRISRVDRSNDWIGFESHNINDGEISYFSQESTADTTPPDITMSSPLDLSILTTPSVHFDVSASDTSLGFIVPDLNHSLISWWRMDDYNLGKGDVNDYLSRTSCSNSNATQVSDGDFGKAFSFNGTNSYLDCGNNGPVQVSNGTIGAWIKTSDVSHGYKTIIGKGNAYNLVLSDGVLGFQDGKGFVSSGAPAINDNSWHYVSASFGSKSNNVSMYIDGSLVATAKISQGNQSSNLYIGQGNNGKGDRQSFSGYIDEVMLFNRILSVDEINALYNGTLILGDTNFEDGSYTYRVYASDKSGNVGSSSIVNFTVDTAHNILGTGTLEDPYKISYCGQLQTLGEQVDGIYTYLDNPNIHIKLEPLGKSTSIDCTKSADLNGGQGFIPLGDSNHFFQGTFDGRGYAIDGLFINNVTSDYTGLFVGNAGTISNVGLINSNISADFGSYTGALAGENDGIINNSYSTGIVSSTGNTTGGFVGYNDGTINYSYSSASISGVTDVGGLVGSSDSIINNSYAIGSVDASGVDVGGLVGFNNFGNISNSYARGNVSGSDIVGGFVGSNNGTISMSYSTGSVSGSNAGGLAGICDGSASGNSYWDIYTSGIGYSNCGDEIGVGSIGVDGSDSDMKDSTIYQNNSWNFSSLWSIDLSVNDGFPYLSAPAITTVLAGFNTSPLQVKGTQIFVDSFVSDSSASNVNFSVEYSLDGGITWNNANSLSDLKSGSLSGNIVSGITTNGIDNQLDSFAWNFVDDGVDTSYSNVLLRITPNDGTVYGDSVVSDPFDINYEVPPSILALSPENNSSGVPIDTSFVITFDRLVNIGSGYVSIINSSDDSLVGDPIDVTSGQVSGDGTDTITITSNVALQNNTTYYIQIDSGAFKNLSNIDFGGISDPSIWTFTTLDNMGDNTLPDTATNLGPDFVINDGTTTSTQPTFNFHLSDQKIDSTVKYSFFLTNDLVSDSPDSIISYTSDVGDNPRDASFTVGQDVLGGSYINGAPGQTLEVGNYRWKELTLDNNDNQGNWTDWQTFSVASSSEIATSTPVITLLGSPHLIVYQGQTYIDAGATAYDSIDHDISNLVSSSTVLDTSNTGTYTITYNVTNSAHISAVPVTRIIKVIPVSTDTSLIDNEGDSEIKNTDIFVPKEIQNPKLDLSAFQSEAGTSTATITKDITITKTMSSNEDIIVSIASSTVLTASSSTWNGVINLPQSKTSDAVTIIPSSGKTATFVSAAEVGLGSTILTSSLPVRILFKGANVNGNLVGWTHGNDFTPVTFSCSGDTGDSLSVNDDCRTSVGSDLIVWTKHFTTYVVYTEASIYVPLAPAPEPTPARGGGGGGGGGMMVVATTPTLTVPIAVPTWGIYTSFQNVFLSQASSTSIRYTTDDTAPTCSFGNIFNGPIKITTNTNIHAIACTSSISSPVVNYSYIISDQAEVLAGQLVFKKNLLYGMTDVDVITLQKFLNSEGYIISKSGPGSVGNESSYFGKATAKALIAFQKSNAIIPVNGELRLNSRMFIASLGEVKEKNVNSQKVSSRKVVETFDRNLKLGSTGNDVKRLQVFLNSNGYIVAKKGKGSAGNETNVFDKNTKNALIKFQEAHYKDILESQNLTTGTGNFSGYTRSVVNKIISSQ